MAGILAALCAASWLLVSNEVDRSVADALYVPGQGWPAGEAPVWLWLYRYGTVPGLLLTLAALIGFGASYASRWLSRWRRELLLVFLTAVVGGGVFVNALFKPYWGRPRPRQVQEFGGLYDYREFYRPGVPGKGQSFPCGHCTMGFVFVSLAFLRRRAPAVAVAGTGFGIVYGGLLGVCRIFQGAHFVTDVLWSFGILLMTAAALHYLVLPKAESLTFGQDRLRKRLAAPLLALMVLGIVLAFLTRRPFFETRQTTVPIDSGVQSVLLTFDPPLESHRIEFDELPGLRVRLQAQGFGWSLSSVGFSVDSRRGEGAVSVHFGTVRKGYFSEFNQRVQVWAPERLRGRISVRASSDAVFARPEKGKRP